MKILIGGESQGKGGRSGGPYRSRLDGRNALGIAAARPSRAFGVMFTGRSGNIAPRRAGPSGLGPWNRWRFGWRIYAKSRAAPVRRRPGVRAHAARRPPWRPCAGVLERLAGGPEGAGVPVAAREGVRRPGKRKGPAGRPGLQAGT